mmetsp:Transcript_24686/g.51235  ORF Transcript_24686/g.51235 Transcript_24686/m.51235 type:complete len:498 (+) Transcript_24686:175-1668(+)|eukprot:CAMPEP_0171379024 /NCGR_PEP_ID=MMETSP0879-20121228/25441_1 /TAXON_ID=67004 /ORGANISM="Thalassiosira weissflogii, Strain CCMP1336" /LENGTH=497 /DNA_ID=CAMNT_0011889645 /DNA_START=89 /DNA_END=1582 /DNA_ORIENTATION=+
MLDDYISIHHIHRKNTEDLGSSSEEEDFKEETPQIQIETHSCGTDQASEAGVDYNLDHDDDDIIPAGEPHVIVIGGGPAGILMAIILRQRGIRVTVLEKMETQDKWSSRSYSINLNQRGRNALFKAGVLDEVIEVSAQRYEIVVHDGITGKMTTIIPKYPPDVAVSRPDLTWALEQVLMEKYNTKVKRGARVNDFVLKRPDDMVEVVLKDGKSFVGTHLVGADGKWSTVRDSIPYFRQQAFLRSEPCWGVHMTAPELPPKWTKGSTVIFRPRKDAMFYVICAPLPSGKCSITMVCYDETLQRYPWLAPPIDSQKSWTSEQWKLDSKPSKADLNNGDAELSLNLEELFLMELPAFLDAGIDRRTLRTARIHPRVSWLDMNLPMQTTNNSSTTKNLARDESCLFGEARYSTPGGGVALVGDSCHACTASLGQGCNLALDSAVALGDAIDECSVGTPSNRNKISSNDLSLAFANYGRTRPEVVRPIQAASEAASKNSHKW